MPPKDMNGKLTPRLGGIAILLALSEIDGLGSKPIKSGVEFEMLRIRSRHSYEGAGALDFQHPKESRFVR